MKMTRKILALILALVMVMGLATTAFAAEHAHTITITNNREKYEYKAYQIFSGELSSTGVLSDIKWGAGVDGAALLTYLKETYDIYDHCNLAEEVAGVLNGLADDHETAFAFAEAAAKYTTTAAATAVYAEGKYTMDVTGDGYYLVVNTAVPEDDPSTEGNEAERAEYSRYILEVVKDVQVSHKGGFPTIDKDILDPNPTKINEAGIGEVVNYQITGNIPTGIQYYSTYYYVFTDTLSKGLTYVDGSLNITVNGIDVTDKFYHNISAYNETDGTTIIVGTQDLLALELADGGNVGEINADTKVIITYSATVNENAVIGKPNPNEVYLEYDNNPNDDGDGSTTPPPPGDVPVKPDVTGITPTHKVETYTTALKIQKTDGAGKPLEGAQFKLEGETMSTVIVTGEKFVLPEGEEVPTYYKLKDNTYTEEAPVTGDDPATEGVIEESNEDEYETLTPTYVKKAYVLVENDDTTTEIEAFVDEYGILTFTGLPAGSYTLTETTTPEGHNSIAPINFTISFDSVAKEFESDNSKINLDGATNTFYTVIENKAGATLPSTGGMGTTLFYVIGTVMVLGSAVLLVTKKRMIAE